MAHESNAIGMPRAAALELLGAGKLELLGRLTEATNATFLCRVVLPVNGLAEKGDLRELGLASAATERATSCVYKPLRGERPLDDFPSGTLANRERAAYLLSEAIGWDIVPPTVLREGPLGPGMAQLWIDVDPEADVLQMVVTPDARLRRMALYDVIANNADRKGGHLLPVPGGHVHGVDHGVCFAEQPKLRTVLWGWRGQKLTDDELGAVARVADALEGPLGTSLGELLSPAEVTATVERTAWLLSRRRFPLPDPSRPAVPWPPF